jgi:hypothetical protein
MLKAEARALLPRPTEIAERRLWHDVRRNTPCLGLGVPRAQGLRHAGRGGRDHELP